MLKSLGSINPSNLSFRRTKYSLFLFALLLITAAGSAAHLNLAQGQLVNGVYDTDGDRLIEISNLQQLHSIRYDLNGDGRADSSSNNASYALGFPLSGAQLVCDRTCRGYELTRSLDFDDANSYQSADVNTDWTEGAGWQPIQEFRATFDGNGHTISNLYMDVTLQQSRNYTGLFGQLSSSSPNSPAVIEDIGLLDVDVAGLSFVGGLVGYNGGQVSRSYVTGAVSGSGSLIGGLVGFNGGKITGSYSTAAVEDTEGATAESNVGGLVGRNGREISESYATGQARGYRNVGGLAGQSDNSSIHSSYATGTVTGDSRIGGLVGDGGQSSRSGSLSLTITDSYATGAVAGDSDTGGLLGNGVQRHTTINNSYWNTDVFATGVGGGGALGASGKTTAELQRPTGPTGIYSLWTSPSWDFGSSSQYPVLKADLDGDGTATAAEFGGQGRAAQQPLPSAAAIVSVSPGVESLTVSWRAPSGVGSGITAYDLRHILISADQTVDANWTVVDDAWTASSGALQYVITGLTGSTLYGVQVRAVNSAGEGLWSTTATGTPHLNLAQGQLVNGVYDTDGDRLIEISNLQQLHFIRYDLNGDGRADSSSNNASYALGFPLSGAQLVCDRTCRGYELTRSLDFDDANSYQSADVNTDWTEGAGWQPIQEFRATFDGNGHTISNLYMDVTLQQSRNYTGLFGQLSSSSPNSPAVIEDIGLLDVDVAGLSFVGGLVGYNGGQVSRSYVTGAVSGSGSLIGGLVGFNGGKITGSYSTAAVEDTEGATAESNVGGLVGRNGREISESYATGQARGYRNVGGLAGQSDNSSIHSSYATGTVTGDSRIGGLVGDGGQSSRSGSLSLTITDSYATGAVAGDSDTGGLLGNGVQRHTTINNSYWNTDVFATGVGGGGALGASGKTTAELQRPTGPTGIYSLWTSPSWDFGSSSQYPVLKADLDGDGTATAAEFGGQGRAAQQPLPSAAAIVSVSPGVESLTVSWRAPSGVGSGITAYDLRHILISADQTVDANWTVVDDAWTASSGALQYVITGLTGSTLYGVQVRAVNSAGEGLWSTTATGTPHLNLAQGQLVNGVYDTDGDRLIEISNLQQLHFIRYDLNGDGRADSSSNNASYALGFPLSGAQLVCDRTCRGYELTRSLDFDDANSYQSADVNTDWTEGAGWQPIQEFRATFDGNGHTISNLYMDVTLQQSRNYTGLFGQLSSSSPNSPAVIEDIGLLDVDVAGLSFVGGLVGYNGGQVSRSYVTGAVSGSGSLIGGLVGFNGGKITGSYSTAAVEDTEGATAESNVGGLVGRNGREISESYATGQARGYRNVGGLAGQSDNSSIHSSYATGTVTGDSRIGGLVGDGGQSSRSGSLSLTITDSYATGAVAGDSDTGGLLGNGVQRHTTINNSYWNTDVFATGVGGGGALGASGKTTAELQRPTGPTGIYSLWTSPSWDFGSSSQYPVLKADLDGDGTATAAEFGGQGRAAQQPLPSAAAIVSVSPGVESLTVSWRAPSGVGSGITAYDLRHILISADQTVDANWTVVDDAWTASSGALQYVITGLTGSTLYGVQVRAVNSAGEGLWSTTATGTPHLNLAQGQLVNGVYDTDGDRLIEISNLQQLHFIRYDLNGDGRADSSSNNASYALGFPLSGAQLVCDRTCRGYELTRSLDFDDANSYQSADVNTDWTEGAGWQPIQEFRATFDGNGHTISNLYMDVTLQQSRNYTGLFGQLSSSSPNSPAVIEDIGLLDVDVAGLSFVGGLVGYNGGQVSRSYVTGAVSGSGSLIGGLVGFNGGKITGSYSTAAVEDTEGATAESNVGGLVGRNGREISESYATGQARGYRNVGGLAGQSDNSSIHSSYATGTVTGDSRIGGLVGDGGQSSRSGSLSLTITDSYATGAVAGDSDTGGLLGNGVQRHTTINNSYWNTDVFATGVGGGGALGASGKTTAELQRPTGPTDIYSLWTSPSWDFGSSSQYPVLKADLDGDGTATAAEFGGQGRAAQQPLPSAAAIVSVSPGVESLTVSWRAPSGVGSGITAYDLRHILISADQTVDANWTVVDDAWTASSGALQYVITGLTGSTLYGVQVRAVNSAGEGLWSTTATGTPETTETPGTSGASRSFSALSVDPGEELTVTIADAGSGAAQVVETLPAGFSYVASSLSEDSVEVLDQTITFDLLEDATFTYTVTASSVEGVYSFEGVLKPFEGEETSIGGASTVTVGSAPAVELSIEDSQPLQIRIGSHVPVIATFTETVSGFTRTEITVVNGAVANFVAGANGMVYTFDVTPNAIGEVTVDIAAGVAEDADGKGNAAGYLSLGITYDDDGDGAISRNEVLAAITDYFADRITRDEVLGVITLYFAS